MADVQVIRDTIAKIKPERKEGVDFYKFFFTTHPELRTYFKGAENFTAADVEKSERFAKLGEGLLQAMHQFAKAYDNGEAFKGQVCDLMNRHVPMKIDPVLWKAFFGVWIGFLETKMPVDDKTKQAWLSFGDKFNNEAQAHLKNSGLPHAG